MGPNTPEQNPPEKSQPQAKETADQIMAEMHKSYDDRYADLSKIKDDDVRGQKRAQLDKQILNEFGSRVRDQIARDTADTGRSDSPEEKQNKAKNAKRIFLEAKVLSDRNLDVVNRKSQAIVDKIVEKIKTGEITDSGALAAERIIGKQLLEGVVFGNKEQPSDFENGLKNLLQVDHQTAEQIIGNIVTNPETYGIVRDDFLKRLNLQTPESNVDSQSQQPAREMGETEKEARRFGNDYQYYQSRFTKDQLDLISTFYSPETFVSYMEQLSNETSDGKIDPEAVKKEKQGIAEKIKDYYEKKNEPKNEGQLKDEVDRHWGEMVSAKMNWRVSDVVNQLFLELQQKSPYKFYEEIMQEDIFQGPAMIQKRIQAAINSLMTKVDQIEKNGNDSLAQRMKNLKLYRISAKGGSYIEERGDDPDNKKLYPRLHPLPFGEETKSLSEFVQYINTTINQTILKAEYFHNSRAMYGHPAGEKGFYGQLGGYAESLHGTDIDEIMLLPDGQYIMQAYQLYEKMFEEDLAFLDWRHRPDQMTNELERVNSKIEREVFDQLKAFYPDLPKDRVRNILNSAIGIGRGIFLTEPEKLAYTDPVDSEGKGMIASYSTNDATSLNPFNPLQTSLRWQGEHNWNMMYFMPVEGQSGKMWDHKKAWTNMAKYMDSFLVGKGQGEGKDKRPEVFADVLIDINKVGGPNKRKGWRMTHSLEGHYVYEKAKDAQGKEYSTNVLDPLKSFKAMEAIGYEAIANFIDTDLMGKKLLKASESTDPVQAKEKKELFRYIFQRYFSANPDKFQESDLDNYLSKLRVDGENETLKNIKKNQGSTSIGTQSVIDGSWEEQVTYETSKLFMKNVKAYYVAARMPSKFLRIDRNRFNGNGISRWERVYRKFKTEGWDRGKFDTVIKDMNMAEMLFRREISEQIRNKIAFDKELTLDKIDDLPSRLDKDKIKQLLSTNKSKDKNNNTFKSPEEINDVVELWEYIKADLNNNKFLDGEGAKKIEDYKFTFGLEDTDISLIAYRGTGPRMIARAIKDVGSIEENITKWITQMPRILSEIAINGKHDFSPIIEYLRKGQQAIFDIHGSEEADEFVYKIAGTVINYFKKDAASKGILGLFGLRRLGQLNSMAAEYAGRSTAVWEWDSRDIDRFAVALESYRLLPKNAYDLNKTKRAEFVNGKWVEGKFIGGQLEDRWVKLPGMKPFKFGKQKHIDFEYNGARLRKAHGADLKAITFDMVNQFLPLALAFLLWKYIKDAMDEATGAKKK